MPLQHTDLHASENASGLVSRTSQMTYLHKDFYMIAFWTQLHGSLRCSIANEGTQQAPLQHTASAHAPSALAHFSPTAEASTAGPCLPRRPSSRQLPSRFWPCGRPARGTIPAAWLAQAVH